MSSKSRAYVITLVIIIVIAILGVVYLYNMDNEQTVSQGTFVWNEIIRNIS